MPSFVVKVAPDVDQYVVWSTVTESPHAWGTRDEIAEYLTSEAGQQVHEYQPPPIEERFARADLNGTSAFHGGYGWEDAGIIFEQRGWLPRARLAGFLDSFDPDTETFDLGLLEPFKEDDRTSDARI